MVVRGKWFVLRPERIVAVVLVCGVFVVFLVVRVGPGRMCLVVMLEMDYRPGDARHVVFLPIWRYGLLISPLEVLRIRHQIVMILTVVIAICVMTDASTVIGCNACWAYWPMYFYGDDIVCMN